HIIAVARGGKQISIDKNAERRTAARDIYRNRAVRLTTAASCRTRCNIYRRTAAYVLYTRIFTTVRIHHAHRVRTRRQARYHVIAVARGGKQISIYKNAERRAAAGYIYRNRAVRLTTATSCRTRCNIYRR